MKLSLPEWLRFKDRDESPYNPVQHDLIVTNRFTSNTRSEGKRTRVSDGGVVDHISVDPEGATGAICGQAGQP